MFARRKRKYVTKLIERANYHDDLSARLEEEGDTYSADMAKIIADVFRLVAEELEKL